MSLIEGLDEKAFRTCHQRRTALDKPGQKMLSGHKTSSVMHPKSFGLLRNSFNSLHYISRLIRIKVQETHIYTFICSCFVIPGRINVVNY